MTSSNRANQKVKSSIRVQFRHDGFMDSVTGEWETDVLPGETEDEAINRANERALYVALSLKDKFVARMFTIKHAKEK